MRTDAVVIGGGPAGAAAARLLALWGHRVRLFTQSPYGARTVGSAKTAALAESLPPSCGKLFDLLGVRDAIDGAGFVRSTGNTVWWGSHAPRIEPFEEGLRGWQVPTDMLARLLLTAAERAGVHIEHRRVAAEDVDSIESPIVLDCTGRAGVVAKARGWRVYEPALRTVALVGAWRRSDAWPVPDSTHTLVESYADGWAWSVPLADGTRHMAVMVDPRSTDLAKSHPSREIYLAEVAKARQFAALTRGAVLEGGPWGWDASMYSSTRYADGRVLVVGDAGSFIDPLSSAGVKKALASGWLAAVAAHTALLRPAMRQTAFDFFAAREREVYERFRSLTQRFLADAAAAHAHPFWTDRAGPLESPRTGFTAEALREDPAVQAAFARIREAPSLRVRGDEQVRVEPHPAIGGCEIVLEPRLAVPECPEGVRFVCDVDVVALLDLAPAFTDVGDLFEAYTSRSGPVPLPDFLLVLATAIGRGWLTWHP